MAASNRKKLDLPKVDEAKEAAPEAKEATTEETSSFQVNVPDTGERKKEFKVVRGTTGNWVIKLEGGGKVPAKLSGQYTRHDHATRAIEQYLTDA